MIITYILLHEINNTAELFLLDNIRRQLRGKIILIMIIIISMKEGKGAYQHTSRNCAPPSFILISYLLMSSFLGLIRASCHWGKWKVFSRLSPHFGGCNSTAPGQGDTWTILSIFGLQHGIPLGKGVGLSWALRLNLRLKTGGRRNGKTQDGAFVLIWESPDPFLHRAEDLLTRILNPDEPPWENALLFLSQKGLLTFFRIKNMLGTTTEHITQLSNPIVPSPYENERK